MLTTTSGEQGWCFLPVLDAHVPAVDENDAPAPVAVADLTCVARLTHQGTVYGMTGDAVLEFDLDGREDHVFCLCERRLG
jgi:hypothetical protein